MSDTGHVHRGFAELNGTTLYYEVAGEGHPFVLTIGAQSAPFSTKSTAPSRPVVTL
jgi:hypothetical protein